MSWNARLFASSPARRAAVRACSDRSREKRSRRASASCGPPFEKILETLFARPDRGDKRHSRQVHEQDERGKKSADRGQDDKAMTAEPMHGAHSKKAFRARPMGICLSSRSEKLSCPSAGSVYFPGPTFPKKAPADLPTWHPRSDRPTASEVGQILTNKQLAGGDPAPAGITTCQEPLTPRPAGSDANASSIQPRVIAAAVPNFSVTRKTRR